MALAIVKTPMVVDAAAKHVQQAIVLGQLLQMARLAMPGEVTGGGAEYANIVRGDGQRNQAGVFGLAVAQGNVHGLAEQVGDAITEQQAHVQLRVLLLEGVQPRQQLVAAEIRRCRQLQHTTDVILATGQ